MITKGYIEMTVFSRQLGSVVLSLAVILSTPAWAQDRTWSDWWAGKPGQNPADTVMAAGTSPASGTRMQSGIVVQDPSTMSVQEMENATATLEQRTKDIREMKAKIESAGARSNAAWMAQDNVVRQKQIELKNVAAGIVTKPGRAAPVVQEQAKKIVIRPNAVPVQEWEAINRANAAAKITQQQNKPVTPAPVAPTTPVTPKTTQ